MRTRVSKVTYGVFVDTRYNPSDPDHESRSHNAYDDVLSGEKWISQYFSIILPKVSRLLIPFLKSMLLKRNYRIRKFSRRRNSDGLIPGIQVQRLVFARRVFLFGVTVEIS